MLKITRVKSLIKNPISFGKDNSIDKQDGNSKINRVKSMDKKNEKLAKSKNMVKSDFSIISKILVAKKPSFKSRFSILRARLPFAKLIQAFIRAFILHHLD